MESVDAPTSTLTAPSDDSTPLSVAINVNTPSTTTANGADVAFTMAEHDNTLAQPDASTPATETGSPPNLSVAPHPVTEKIDDSTSILKRCVVDFVTATEQIKKNVMNDMMGLIDVCVIGALQDTNVIRANIFNNGSIRIHLTNDMIAYMNNYINIGIASDSVDANAKRSINARQLTKIIVEAISIWKGKNGMKLSYVSWNDMNNGGIDYLKTHLLLSNLHS